MFSFRSFFTSIFNPFRPTPAPAPVVRTVLDDTDVSGASWIDATSSTEPLRINMSRDTVAVDGRSYQTAGKPNFQGGSGDDVIKGNSSANRINGGLGNDTLYGRDGADTLDGGAGNDQLLGEVGDDVLFGGQGDDVLDGGIGTDILRGGAGDDTYIVDVASDTVVEADAEGYDTVRAAGDYTLSSGQYIERLEAADPSSTDRHKLFGNGLQQTIAGGAGQDTLDGAGGGDTLMGGLGDDSYTVYSSDDKIVERAGGGFDTVVAKCASYTLTPGAEVERVELESTTSPAFLYGKYSTLTGNELSQTVVGNGLNNIIDGGDGNDTLVGGNPTGGANVLAKLIPYICADADTFRFSTPLGPQNVDNIVDFNSQKDPVSKVLAFLTGQFVSDVGNDRIELSQSVFAGLPLGALSPDAFCRVDKYSVKADHRILYDYETGFLSYDADGSGAAPSVKFAELASHTLLYAANIIVWH